MFTIEQAFEAMRRVIHRRLRGQSYSFWMNAKDEKFVLNRFDTGMSISFIPDKTESYWLEKATFLCEVAEKVMNKQ